MSAEPSSFQARFGLTVTPQNVLGVRAVILQEAHDLRNMLRAEQYKLVLPPLGGDPVSRDMSREFNTVTRTLLDRADRHIASLFALGEELAAAARSYGRAEQEIAGSFAPGRDPTLVSQVPAIGRQILGLSAAAARPPARTLGDLLSGGPR